MRARIPQVVARRRGMVDGGLEQGGSLARAVVAAATGADRAPPTQLGRTRVGGIEGTKPRRRAGLAAVLACALRPTGFRVGARAAPGRHRAGALGASAGRRPAASDGQPLRAKGVVDQAPGARRYDIRPEGARSIAALVVLGEQVRAPLLAGTAQPRPGRKPTSWTRSAAHYQTVRQPMQALFAALSLAA